MPRPYGKVCKGHRIPYGAMVGVSPELRLAYYSNGYKNDDAFPELPCPPQDVVDYVCPEEETYRKEVSAFIQNLIDEVLTPRQIKVIRCRFGIQVDYDHTLEEIADIYELTRERIRQIEMRALRKLAHPEFKLREVFNPVDCYRPTNQRKR